MSQISERLKSLNEDYLSAEKELSELNQNDLNALWYFINKHWKSNHFFIRNKSFFNYQYKFLSEKFNFFKILSHGKIESILGYIPSNSNFSCIWLALWKSIVNTQGLIILNKIINSKSYDFIGVLGISDSAKKTYQAYKWETGNLKHYFLYVSNKKFIKKPYKFCLFKEPKIVKSNHLPVKDYDYYLQRFKNHPVFKYYSLELKKHDIQFIGRIVKYNNLNVFHVVDYIGDINNTKISYDIQSFLSNENLNLFEFMYYDSRKIITDLKIKKDEIIPTYFNPFENKNINVEFAYSTSSKKNIRFVLADGDQDRPN
tara:strand:- start:246 stop:1187 length:942 start_codon:yes stop_codon:yes gene_type:complete